MDRSKIILECVPNFSEGRRPEVIEKILESIQGKNVNILRVDTGFAANRTVVTFAGEPEAIVEPTYRAVKKAIELIDMSQHHGVHPRIGAIDVLPFAPVSGITMPETIELSNILAERIGKELKIPVYLYEYSAKADYRKKLESIRKGEYEGLEEKMKIPFWKPDFGPTTFNAKSGATIMGARNFLVAFNVNLDTKSTEIAKQIAAEIRESGYFIHENGQKKHIPGILKNVKAIGWYINDFDKVQVSMNLTNIDETPVHIAYKTVAELAEKYHTKVTGSELIGLIPLKTILSTGIYFSNNKNLNEKALIEYAIQGLGLNELAPFSENERILEYKLSIIK